MTKITAKQAWDKIKENRGEELGFVITPGMVSAIVWMTQADTATQYGDRVSKHLKGQRLCAESCRYHEMAKKILGPTDYPDVLRHPDYGMTNEFASWDFEI